MKTPKRLTNGLFLSDNCKQCPLIISITNEDPVVWLRNNKDFVDKTLSTDGAILLRKFNINSLSEFNKFAQSLTPKLLDYTYRSTPRRTLGGKIYTATEYPAEREIPLHNENSYTLSWPEKIMFFCVLPAEEGGYTPIADSRKVYNRISKRTIDLFDSKGVMYVRNYIPGIDLSWQEVFQTNERSEVEVFCQNHGLDYKWHTTAEPNKPILTTSQICQATLRHPKTGELVWFNQAHLFHNSSLDQVSFDLLVDTVGIENMPRNSFFGDGQPIPIEILEEIRSAYEKEKILFQWQKSDLLILDNILMTHGRTAFKGNRKIAVAMA